MVGASHRISGVVYPPEEALRRYIEAGCLDDRSLAGALNAALARAPDQAALIGPAGRLTYGELDDQATRFAAALLDLGLRPLDRVIFQTVNSNELIIALVACWKANLIPVCTLAAHREKEISYLARHAEAKAHFIGVDEKFDFLSFARDIREKTSSLEHIVVVRSEPAWEAPSDISTMQAMIDGVAIDAARARLADVEHDPFQVAVFQLSGGTTSIPKIIPRFANEYLYNMDASIAALEMTADDVVLAPAQFIHNAGMIFLLATLLSGGVFVVVEKLDPAILLGVLTTEHPTVVLLTAAALGRMKQFNVADMADFSRTRLVISTNAAPQSEEVLGVCGVHLFGMTEGTIMFGRPGDPEEARFTTVGRPISPLDEIRIVEPGSTRDVAVGEAGEMLVRGPYTFHGYYDAEARNKEAFTEDGYYRSGDLMRARVIGGETYYAFEGRLKDIVSRGYEKINCEEVERAARAHPQISDIAIVAMPDPDLEERACAFIIPASAGATSGAAPDVEALGAFLVEAGLAKFKCPERIEVVSEFPLTDSGKLSKPKLKQKIIDILNKEKAP